MLLIPAGTGLERYRNVEIIENWPKRRRSISAFVFLSAAVSETRKSRGGQIQILIIPEVNPGNQIRYSPPPISEKYRRHAKTKLQILKILKIKRVSTILNSGFSAAENREKNRKHKFGESNPKVIKIGGRAPKRRFSSPIWDKIQKKFIFFTHEPPWIIFRIMV